MINVKQRSEGRRSAFRLLLLISVFSVSAFQFSNAAITERYVTSTGTDTYANSTNSATPMSLTTALANAVAGDRINVKAATYSQTTTTNTVTNSGTITSPIIFRGYSSSIADGNLGRTNGNGALVTTNMPSITYTTGRMNTTATFILWESINFSGAPSNPVLSLPGNSAARNCKAVNSSTNASAVGITATGNNAIIFDCDSELSGASGGSAGVNSGGTSARVLCNRIKGGPAIGIICSASNAVVGNVIFASTGNHISMNSTAGVPLIFGNTLVGGGADAINIITGTTGLQCIINNMLTDNTGNGINMVSTSNGAFSAYNRTRGNAAGYAHAGDWSTATKYSDVTSGSGTDYVNSGSNDYRLLYSSPAHGAGWFPYADIGALHRKEPPQKIPSIGP